MLNAEQIRVVKELIEDTPSYLEQVSNSVQKKEIEKRYEEFKEAYNKFYSNVMDEVLMRIGYDKALRSKKVDPYIAGGIGQSIAGIGGGIYAATNTAANNARIDASRAHYRSEVFHASNVTSGAESRLLSLGNRLDEALESVPAIAEQRETKRCLLYNRAVSMMFQKLKKQQLEEAKKIFESLGGYRDCPQLVLECEQKIKTARQLLILIYSGLLTLFVDLVSGIASAGIEAFVAVSLIAYVISWIMLQIKFK